MGACFDCRLIWFSGCTGRSDCKKSEDGSVNLYATSVTVARVRNADNTGQSDLNVQLVER